MEHQHIYDTIYDENGKLCGDCLLNKRGTFRELSTSNPQKTDKPKVGRPCKYCSNKEHYQKIADEYLKKHRESEKPTIPWIEELALKMEIDDGTLVLWAKKLKNTDETEDDESRLEHPELSASYTILKSLQKLRLKQRALGRFNPHGALYLLNADHKVIQTTKDILVGDKNEPLKIEFVAEKPIPEDE